MDRRKFLQSGLVAPAAASVALSATQARFAVASVPVEWSFSSGKAYRDPSSDVEVAVEFTAADGARHTVPAFWAGEQVFSVRYAAPKPGSYRWRSVCSDTANTGLHDVEGTLEVAPYEGANPLYRRGKLTVSQNRRYLQYSDGTPFFWLGDTWWLALTKRLSWPDDFRQLVADRTAKGFNVIQLVAGLFPDMDSFDPRGANEAGLPWEKDYSRLKPAFFDMADLRIQYLVQQGLTPCIVGCWGYYLPKLGMAKMKQHWRNLVARWGAYPVVWCLAGEGTMPWYLSDRKDADREELKKGWTEIARYVRQIDPYRRLITIHPSRTARESVDDATVIDFDMLQTGHGDRKSIANTIKTMAQEYAAPPTMPVINGEVCYEGILAASREEVQRFMFWSCVLNGAPGHTYGANGIWQVNRAGDPFGPSPHGRAWGSTPWDVAMRLPGSAQLGLSADLLRSLPWWRFEPHPEWVTPHWGPDNFEAPSAAGIPGEMRVIYLPAPAGYTVTIQNLEPNVRYRAKLVNPIDGKQGPSTPVDGVNGSWKHPMIAEMQDWVLILERV